MWVMSSDSASEPTLPLPATASVERMPVGLLSGMAIGTSVAVEGAVDAARRRWSTSTATLATCAAGAEVVERCGADVVHAVGHRGRVPGQPRTAPRRRPPWCRRAARTRTRATVPSASAASAETATSPVTIAPSAGAVDRDGRRLVGACRRCVHEADQPVATTEPSVVKVMARRVEVAAGRRGGAAGVGQLGRRWRRGCARSRSPASVLNAVKVRVAGLPAGRLDAVGAAEVVRVVVRDSSAR